MFAEPTFSNIDQLSAGQLLYWPRRAQLERQLAQRPQQQQQQQLDPHPQVFVGPPAGAWAWPSAPSCVHSAPSFMRPHLRPINHTKRRQVLASREPRGSFEARARPLHFISISLLYEMAPVSFSSPCDACEWQFKTCNRNLDGQFGPPAAEQTFAARPPDLVGYFIFTPHLLGATSTCEWIELSR